jgi:hypothetical protein
LDHASGAELKNGRKNMKPMKIGVVLLALVLAAMAIVPVVSAENQMPMPPSDVKTLQAGPSPDNDMFAYLGIAKPVLSAGQKWQTYASSKKEVDQILSKSGKQNDVRSIIGYLRGTNEKVVLYSGNDGNIYAILQKKDVISVKKVIPAVIGSKEDQSVDVYSQGIPLDQNNRSVHTTHYDMSRISLADIGSSEFSTAAVYSNHITRTDSWIWLGISRASLYTDGTFTYDYGNQILGISDNSNTYQALGFDQCQFIHSTRVTGVTGYVDSSVIWSVYTAMPPKHSVNAWISSDIYGSTNGNSVTSDWVASGFSCFGVP